MGNRFDDLARTLAGGISRREALRQVGGGLGAAVLAALGASKAAGDPGTGQGQGCGNVCNAAFAPNSSDPTVKAANQQCKDVCETCPRELLCIGTSTTSCCSDFCDSTGVCFEGCFVAGTRIALPDGSEMPIEQIRVGDWVLGAEGQLNQVIEIDHPVLGNRPLYALNGSIPFVTAGHPFMTAEGWKAIDPATAARECPNLPVGLLEPGDLLVVRQPARVPAAAGRVALAEPALPALASVPLTRLHGRRDDPRTALFNLRLDGSHAYFANGLLVHNKE